MEACSIFVLVAKNKRLATKLLKGETQANREKLRYEIKKLLKNAPQTPKTKSEFTLQKEELIPVLKQTIKTDIPTPIHEKILIERKELYLKRGHLHGRLHEAKNDEDRSELAKQIIEIQPRIDELNRDLRKIESGEVPQKYLKTKATAEEYLEVRNAKIYIARYKKQLIGSTPEKQKQLEALILKYQRKLENL